MHRSGSEAHRLGLKLLPETSKNIGTHPLHAQQEPFRKCIPPLVPDFDAVVTVFVSEPSEVPSSALSKTSHALSLHSPELSTLVIPANSRFLRFYSAFESTSGEREREKDSEVWGRKGLERFPFRAAFGLPWSPEAFIQKAASARHPAQTTMGIPEDLDIALERIIMYEIGPDHDVQRRFHAGISAAVHKIPTTGKIHTQPVLRVCPGSTHNSANYTGISTRKLLVVRSPFKVVKLLFFGKSMLFYESSFCSSFLLVLVNLVDARSKDR